MIKWLIGKWNSLKLEEKIFTMVILVGSAACIMAGITTWGEGLGCIASYTAFAFGLLVLLYGWFAVKKHLGRNARTAMVYAFNCILFPLMFLVCGGIETGTVCFMILGGFLCSVFLEGKSCAIAFLVGISVQSGSIWLHYYLRDFMPLHTEMTEIARYGDYNFSLVLASAALSAVTGVTVREYQKQMRMNQELVEQMRDVLKQDALTGLFNRRKLYEVLENLYPQLGDVHSEKVRFYYLVMYDIDHFKKLNDTYGHQFGDKVLKTVAGILQLKVYDSQGEFVSRYGGEEFVCVLKADNLMEAAHRAEEKRREIEQIKWPDAADLTVTISGGVTGCVKYKSMDEALSAVDALLYEAKNSGRNRIISK